MGLGQDFQVKIADKIETLAREFQAASEFEQAIAYFQVSADWFKANEDDEKFADMKALQAEMLVKEAISAETTSIPRYIVAVGKYEQAIQIYRDIPRAQRGEEIDARIVELEAKLQESSKEALDSMTTVRFPGVDISDIVENACEAVKNKSPMEALQALANIGTIDVNRIKECVAKELSSPRLLDFMPLSLWHREGRVIGKVPPHGKHVCSNNEETHFFWQMLKRYSFEVQITACLIVPVLHFLSLEHRYREADFIGLARRSPLVPIGCETLFGKALFSGYDLDFATAIYLLAPQIEHMVRVALNEAGVTTTTVNSNGIVNEKGLSALIDYPETREIFGDGLTFEIKAIFCSPLGPNLRNETAHGLMSFSECQTVDVIYAWWLGLRIVFNSFWAWNVMQYRAAERMQADSAEKSEIAE